MLASELQPGDLIKIHLGHERLYMFLDIRAWPQRGGPVGVFIDWITCLDLERNKPERLCGITDEGEIRWPQSRENFQVQIIRDGEIIYSALMPATKGL